MLQLLRISYTCYMNELSFCSNLDGYCFIIAGRNYYDDAFAVVFKSHLRQGFSAERLLGYNSVSCF